MFPSRHMNPSGLAAAANLAPSTQSGVHQEQVCSAQNQLAKPQNPGHLVKVRPVHLRVDPLVSEHRKVLQPSCCVCRNNMMEPERNVSVSASASTPTSGHTHQLRAGGHQRESSPMMSSVTQRSRCMLGEKECRCARKSVCVCVYKQTTLDSNTRPHGCGASGRGRTDGFYFS